MVASIPSFEVTIDKAGQPSVRMSMHLHDDVGPLWLGIALDHLEVSRARSEDVRTHWRDGSDSEKGSALDRELEASVQAIVASATAIESLFANVRELCPSSDKIDKAKRSRAKRVSALLDCAFKLGEDEAADVALNLAKVYRLRNDAVHPSGSPTEVVLRQDIDVGVERRFATYSFTTARGVVGWTVAMFCNLARRSESVDDERLRQYLHALKRRLEPLLPRARLLCETKGAE